MFGMVTIKSKCEPSYGTWTHFATIDEIGTADIILVGHIFFTQNTKLVTIWHEERLSSEHVEEFMLSKMLWLVSSNTRTMAISFLLTKHS